MWFRRKVIIIPVLIALVLAGSIAGFALAQGDSDTSGNTLLARVAAILGIDQTKVEDAFAQAQKEMREEALNDYLKKLVDEGKITQDEADQYKTWWDTRPDAFDKVGSRLGLGGRGGDFCHGGCGPGMLSPPTP